MISAGAGDITELSEDEDIIYTVAPDDLWARSQESAKSKADIFREHGLPLLKGNRNREAGWLAVKELLTIKNGDSRLKIFSTCGGLIECLPALQRDTKKPTDCMTEPHDITHLPDALRYFCLQYVYPAKEKKDGLSQLENDLQRYKNKLLRGGRARRGYY